MVCSDSRDNPQGKGPFRAAVRGNERIGERFYRVRLEFSGRGGAAFACAEPGQFAQLDVADVPLPRPESIPADLRDASRRNILLRRPYSFSDVTAGGERTLVDIIYCALGPASLRMTSLSAGDSVSIIGPLGNGFSVPADKKAALLVSGGMGAGPLLHLAKVIKGKNPKMETAALLGAKTAAESLFELPVENCNRQGLSLDEFRADAVEWVLDDGPAGHRGFVTERLEKRLDETRFGPLETIIYACGPEPMLATVAQIASSKDVEAQLSMERRMACGIGLCQSCAVECRCEQPGETVYKLCCKDGPVFDSAEPVF